MSDYTAADAHAAAALGAAWLDERCPGWPERINLDILSLDDSQACMLGQTAECILGPRTKRDVEQHRYGYWRVAAAEGWSMGSFTPKRLGFDVPISDDGEDETRYEMLTIAWKLLIRERLAVPA